MSAQTLDFGMLLARNSSVPLAETDIWEALIRLPGLNKDGPWIAGGALRRTILGEPLSSDFDFFFASEKQFDDFCAALKSNGAAELGDHQHAKTFKVPEIGGAPALIVQAIRTRFFNDPADVINWFDFTICQFAFDGQTLTCGEYALWDLGRKRLIPHKISFATASLRRLLKYTRQGFSVCSGGLANILEQVLSDPAIIRAETPYID